MSTLWSRANADAISFNISAKRSGHFAGFDGLRLVGALAVIFSHAFLIATGSEDTEPLVRVLGIHNSIGVYGVFVFFIISGFLLARSLSNDPNAIKYTVNRVLRILPAFVFCILICALLIGPIFSALPMREYFSDSRLTQYLIASIDQLTDEKLPGVFAYDGIVSYVVNGSLWSLHYEALSYVVLLLLWVIFQSSGLVALVIGIVAVLTRLSPAVDHSIVGVAFTLPYFASGVLTNWIHSRYGTHRLGVLITGLALLGSCFLGWQLLAFAPFGAYLVIFLGERPNPFSRVMERIGDCSYGLFLFGWPVEQAIKQVTGTTNPWLLMALSLPFALLLALISCHLIEKPAISLKRVTADFVSQIFKRASFIVGDAARSATVGAKVSFVIGFALILFSEKRWWSFLWSMSEVLLGVVVGTLLTIAIGRAIALSGIALMNDSSP